MEDLHIEAHEFNDAKNQIKKFSEETTTELDIKRVESGKDIGEFWADVACMRGFDWDHRVTGSEFNEFAADIQKYLIDINNLQRKFIEQFGNVYNALESLDNEYIQAILISIKSAKNAYDKAKDARLDIEKAITEQRKIIKILQMFKEELENNKHLDDIDNLWCDNKQIQKTIEELEGNVKKCISKYDRLSQLIKDKENSEDVKKQIKEIDNKYNKKINVAYAIAGCSAILVIVNLFLNMFGVL